jgi:hypothetical protein
MDLQSKLKFKRRRPRRFFWLFAATAVSALVFGDAVALLYIFSALMCGMLLVVAYSNLEAKDAEMQAAAIRKQPDIVRADSRGLSGRVRKAAYESS